MRRAIIEIGDGDADRGRRLLRGSTTTLTGENAVEVAEAERFAVALGDRATRGSTVFSEELRQRLAAEALRFSVDDPAGDTDDPVLERHRALDLDAVRTASNALTAALLVDLLNAREPDRPDAEGPAVDRPETEPSVSDRIEPDRIESVTPRRAAPEHAQEPV